MARREAVEPDSEDATERKKLQRAEFGRRLRAHLIRAGVSQAEFARRAQLRAPEGVRIGTDSLSHYINGRYWPSPLHLKIIADVLQVDVSDLNPSAGPLTATPLAGTNDFLPPVAIEDMKDGTVWLRVNRAVSQSVGLKILSLLYGEDAQAPPAITAKD